MAFVRSFLLPISFSRLVWLAGIAATLLLLARPSWSQVSTASIVGVATDPSGAAIPDSKITVKNLGTNEERSVQTDANGDYRFTLLPVGRYSMQAEHEGFKTFTVAEVALAAGDQLKQDVHLEIGETQQTVEVSSVPPALETQSSTLQTLVDEHAMQDLPLNGRNFVTLAQLAPGSSDTSQGFAGGGRPDDRRQSSTVAVNSQYPWANNFLIDGMDNNERFIGTIVVKPDVEAIAEMRVQTNLYTADVGRTAGGVVNLITKSGTNEFHGSLFEFFRNEHLDARNYFVANAGQPIPSYKQNQFGGSIGGPIKKNKTFFFGSYEGLHTRQGVTFTSTVPTLAEDQGNFAGIARIFDPTSTRAVGSGYVRGEFPNDQIPSSDWNPIAVKLLNLYPAPTTSGLVNNYVTSPTMKFDENTFDTRVDQKISDNDSLFVRYTYAKDDVDTPEGLPLGTTFGFGGPSTEPTQGAQINYVHIFSPSVVMEVRAGYARFHISSLPITYGQNLSQQIGLPGSNFDADSSGLASFDPLGAGTGIGDVNYEPEYNIDNTYQVGGNVNIQRGKHSLKVGGEYRKRQDAMWQSPYPAGSFSFSNTLTDDPSGAVANSGNAFASLLLGYPYLAQRSLLLVHPLYEFSEAAAFMQDDWNVTRWLTLNAGVRWSYYSPLSEKYDRISNFNLSTAAVQVAGQDGFSNTAGLQQNWRDFAPRFGFAATLSAKTVLRGGYGISYVPPFMGSGYAFRNPPFVSSWTETASVLPSYSISQGLPAATAVNPLAPTGTFNAVAYNFQTPYVQQFNMTFERQLPWNLVTNVSYVGLLGRQQPFPNSTVDYNAAAPSTSANLQQQRPFYSALPSVSSISVYGNYSNTSYNALQATLQKRFQNGFDAVANYTWSHATDNFDYLPTATGGMFVRGDSDLDIRQRFTLTANYVLPFAANAKGLMRALAQGWNVNAIVQAQTGVPFTIIDAGDQANIGCTGTCLETPQLIANPNVAGPVAANSNPACQVSSAQGGLAPTQVHTIANWFNPCAFQTQPFGTYGNLGKDTGRGPIWANLDFSAFKDFSVTERIKLQFRGEFLTYSIIRTSAFPRRRWARALGQSAALRPGVWACRGTCSLL